MGHNSFSANCLDINIRILNKRTINVVEVVNKTVASQVFCQFVVNQKAIFSKFFSSVPPPSDNREKWDFVKNIKENC